MGEIPSHTTKVVLIGDAGVGKTSLLTRFSNDAFDSEYIGTIGIDFKNKTLDVDGRRVRIQVWDTSGMERFSSITRCYYRGAQGVVIVYDVADRQTFRNVKRWLKEVTGVCGGRMPELLLVGAKNDLQSKKVVLEEEGQALADELGCDFIEASARSGHNVEVAFTNLSKTILSKAFCIDPWPATAPLALQLAKPRGRCWC
mmetsp:Transcript_68136/g.156347  ORF Transcript_68136/g.156347 Transcript_68136/m.156347 type:complete len:200 (+) Transcript_68136:44-643(+)